MINTRLKISFTSIVAAVVVITGCATGDSLSKGQAGSASVAAAGAVGHQVDGNKSRYAGALAGNAAGRYMDEQQQALEDKLRQEQAANEIQISRLPDNSLKLNLSSKVSFDSDSAMIQRGFQDSLNKVANVLADYPSTAVHVIGYTDSSGPEQYNIQLSVKRASSVQGYLTTQGVRLDRTRIKGFGESMPVANNASDIGRQRNRRVEIYLKPIVEGQEQAAYRSPV